MQIEAEKVLREAVQAEGLDRDPSKRNIVRQDAESGSAGCVEAEGMWLCG